MMTSSGTRNLRFDYRFSVVVVVAFLAAAAASVSAAGRESTHRNHRHSTDGRLLAREDVIRMAGYGEEKLSTVVVTGTLLCAACSTTRRAQLLPVSGASVAVVCNSHSHYKTRNKKPTLIKGATGENGEFIIDLPSHLHAIADLNKACSVKVLHLPKHSPCRSALAVAKRGAHPIVLSSAGNGVRVYTAGTVQFLQGDFGSPNGCKRVAMEPQQESLGSY